MTGIEAVLDILAQAGVRYVFGNPGSTELPLNDALAVDPQDLDRLELPVELRRPPGWLERLRVRAAAPLLRWASPRRSVRG